LAREVNDSKPLWIVRWVEQAVATLGERGVAVDDIKIACLGLTFKPDIGDLRESLP
jgi:UDP-N-acetyl-D-mannosaminuronic acid dehydrogenase